MYTVRSQSLFASRSARRPIGFWLLIASPAAVAQPIAEVVGGLVIGGLVFVVWSLASLGFVLTVFRIARGAFDRRPAPTHSAPARSTSPDVPKDASTWQDLIGIPPTTPWVGEDFMEELKIPGPSRYFPENLAPTLDPSTAPDFEPWRNVPSDYNPIGPDGRGRKYETFNRAERVRYLVSMFHMHMRWNGEDGYEETEIFGVESLQVLRESYPDIDKLMPTILTALAYMWQTRPAVFLAAVNAEMNSDFMVDPTVPMNCYQWPPIRSVGPLRNYWHRPVRKRNASHGVSEIMDILSRH